MFRLVSALSLDRLIIIDPVLHDHFAVVILAVSHNDLLNAGIDDHLLAQGTGIGLGNIISRFRVVTGQIHRCTDHLVAARGNDRILFRVDTSAELISLSTRDLQFLTYTGPSVGTVLSSSRSSHITGGDHLVVLHDHGSIVTSQACASLRDDFRQIQIIIDLVSSLYHRQISVITTFSANAALSTE